MQNPVQLPGFVFEITSPILLFPKYPVKQAGRPDCYSSKIDRIFTSFPGLALFYLTTLVILILQSTILIVFSVAVLAGCTGEYQPTAADEELAKTHCGSCHQYADPALLPRAVWEKEVLPYMALRMGVQSEIEKLDSLNSLEKGLKPPRPQVTEEEWESIKNYYLALAPQQLEDPKLPALQPQRGLFELRRAQLFSQQMANISCIKIDPEKSLVYACDDVNGEIWALKPDGFPENRFNNQLAVSDINLTKQGLLVTYIGKDVRLTTSKNGFSQVVNTAQNVQNNASLLLTGLYRPTQTLPADLNGDGIEELVTCEFGVVEGAFSIWHREPDGTYRQQVLSTTPGALRAQVTDWDQDGKPDLLVLFAQGDERLVWYRNKGNHRYEEKVLMRFPPVYGSSYFELTDLNGDKRPDVIYTCGDNADYSQVLKLYHGVYAFEQQPDGSFTQKFHLPIHGAYKVVARDFDRDGDQDMVAIAYFGNYASKAPNDLVYIENLGGGQFAPRLLPGVGRGRWMCLDAADLDGDGDEDIALGSHPLGLMPGGFRADWANGPGVIYLINQAIRPVQ